jgi:hypothetical protein
MCLTGKLMVSMTEVGKEDFFCYYKGDIFTWSSVYFLLRLRVVVCRLDMMPDHYLAALHSTDVSAVQVVQTPII